MTMSGGARRFLFAATLVATFSGLATQHAQAQAFGFSPYWGPPPFGGYRAYGPPPGYGPPDYEEDGPRYGGPGRRAGAPFASRGAIARLLRERGLRLDGPLEFAGPNIVAIGVDPTGRARRLVIDPYDGAVLAARPLPRQAAREGYGPEDMGSDMPPPPPQAVAAKPRSAARSSENQPVWRDEPLTTGSISHSAEGHPAAAKPHEPSEKRKAPVTAEASAAPAHPAPAPETVSAGAASAPPAPTGELEAPIPGG